MYHSASYATKNENGDAEVFIEHKQTYVGWLFGIKPKIERFVAPHDWRQWHGLSVWRDKATKKFVDPETTLRILNLVHSIDAINSQAD
jgi:hypothetical protein